MHTSEDEGKIKRVLKWAGIIALVALPIAILLKKRKDDVPRRDDPEDDGDRYPSELYG